MFAYRVRCGDACQFQGAARGATCAAIGASSAIQVQFDSICARRRSTDAQVTFNVTVQ